jgi:AraC-like DNA-binding protein
VGAFSFSPASYGRTKDLIVDGNDDFVFIINQSAPLHESRAGSVTQGGGGMLQDNSRAAYIGTQEPGGVWNIVIPRKTLLALAPGAEDAVGRALDPASVPLQLLRGYVTTLLGGGAVQPAMLAMAAQHVAELTALALAHDNARVAESGRAAAKAVRREALTREIAARAADPQLTLAALAKAHGISERYVQKLMGEAGTSFSDALLEARLARAHRELASPAHRARRIADIAFGAGFSDLSHFNRSFRRRYGLTPGDVRRGA